jgi:hypothetical protein
MQNIVNIIRKELKSGVKHNKRSVEKIFLYEGIDNKNLVKELTELAFMNAGNQEKFISDLKNEIEKFSR